MRSKEKKVLLRIETGVVIDMQHYIRAKHWTRWVNYSCDWQSWRRM